MMVDVFLIFALYACSVFIATLFFALSDMNISAEKSFAKALIWPLCLLYVAISVIFLCLYEVIGFVGRGFKELYIDEVSKWRD